MRAPAARGSFLDPRTKILIWLLANVVVFTWAPAVFHIAVMLAYFGLFLLEPKGKTLAGLRLVYLAIRAVQCWLLQLLPGSLATVFATVNYFILGFPCIAGGAYIIATTSVSQFMAALERLGAPRSFSITLAVTLRFLPALRQDFRHIRDATASVDPENEHLIQQALSALTKGKTILTIAHRLATIQHADQILVVEDGRIVQRGTHEELMVQGGLYRRFIEIREQAEGWRIQ